MLKPKSDPMIEYSMEHSTIHHHGVNRCSLLRSIEEVFSAARITRFHQHVQSRCQQKGVSFHSFGESAEHFLSKLECLLTTDLRTGFKQKGQNVFIGHKFHVSNKVECLLSAIVLEQA